MNTNSGYCSRLSMVSVLAAIVGSCLASPALAALPDEDTYRYVTNKYKLFLEDSRDGCSYYANPSDVASRDPVKYLPVLRLRSDRGGTMCNGVFGFTLLTANCNTGELSYSDRTGSPATWVDNRSQNAVVSRLVCGEQVSRSPSLSSSPLSSSNQLPPKGAVGGLVRTDTGVKANGDRLSALKSRSLTQQQASGVVLTWLNAKRSILAPPFDRQLAAELTTGKLYQDLTKPDGSIDWLQRHNARYLFGMQRIEAVKAFFVNEASATATIDAVVTENRTLLRGTRVDPTETGQNTAVWRYYLKREGDRWKITDYDKR